jgi:hypothetical protein
MTSGQGRLEVESPPPPSSAVIYLFIYTFRFVDFS